MKLRKVPIRLIRQPDRPIRERMVDERLEELAESVGERTRNAPIRLTPFLEDGQEVYEMSDEEFNEWVEDYDGEWKLVDGHRRFQCRMRKDDGELWARLDNVKPEQAGMERAKENLHREDVSPIEEGRYFQYLRRTYDLVDKEISERIGKSRTYVQKRRDALDWPEDIKDPLEYDDLKWSHAVILARVDNESHRKRLLRQALNTGATTETVKQWYQNYKRRQRRIEEKQEAAKKKQERKTSEQQAEQRDAAEQVKKEGRTLTTQCSLHRGDVPLENITAIKVCDVCFHALADLQEKIHSKLEALDEDLRYDRMEEAMEKESSQEEEREGIQKLTE